MINAEIDDTTPRRSLPNRMLKIGLLATVPFWTAAVGTYAAAQEAQTEKATDDAPLFDEITVTGSRRKARSASDTPAPVDVISAADLSNQGDTDLTNLLRTSVPSLNVNSQPINDGATLIRPVNLRGLPPDNVLILTNGKRRHRAAVITFLGNGLSDGAQGPDISAIPSIALKQVEVLRDGAAAQYGSDAIAGVINLILSDRAEGGRIEAKYGSTYEGDGDQMQFAGIIGTSLGDNGFVNLSAEYRESDPTSRSVQRSDAASLIAGGNTNVGDPAQVWGNPRIHNDLKLFINMAVEAGDSAEFYAFGNYSERKTEGGFYFRNPDTRGGVFSNDGGETRLVGDLTDDMSGGCPTDLKGPNHPDGEDAAGFAAVMADPNCFVFNELFPGGFTPSFGGDLNDIAGAVGLRGEFSNGLTYDVSANAGRNEVNFFINNTVNASLGPDTPNDFKLGSYTQLEKNANADFVYPVAIDGLASDLNVAFGAEWREEQFTVGIGQQESWQIGPLAAQGFGIGANGFSGFGPQNTGSWDRTNIGLYLDLEANVTDEWILGTAIRWEDFSDFGSTTNFKVSTLYHITDEIAFRATYSTGFRAPTVGQQQVVNTSTVIEGGVLSQRGTIPPTNPVAVAFGGKQLQPEKSKNFSMGLGYTGEHFSLTVDYFNIKMRDRITQSASIELDDADRANLAASGVVGAEDLQVFRFFTNDFKSRTQGIDVVLSIPMELTDMGTSSLNFVGNWTDTKVTDNPTGLLDATRILQLERNLPHYRANATFIHVEENWRGLLRANYFSGFYEAHAGDGTLPIEAGGEISIDVEVGYNVMENLEFIVGAENVFNNFPDKNPWATVVGSQYPETSPLGFSGGLYYARVKYDF
tara:strand:+ start:2398 stop:4995 length:2598 start_codon:yes stop_codon:yes gene_type:complete